MDELIVQRLSVNHERKEMSVAEGQGRVTSYECPHNYTVEATVDGESVRLSMQGGRGGIEHLSGRRHGRPSHVYVYGSGGVFCRTHDGMCQIEVKGNGKEH